MDSGLDATPTGDASTDASPTRDANPRSDASTDACTDASPDATLASLSPSAGTLSPAFDPSTTQYAVQVPLTQYDFALTPVTSAPGATITVNGTPVASGSASAPSPLDAGTNTFTVAVTAPNGSATRVYTVTVQRGAGARYYVSARSGDDSRSAVEAQDPRTPWKSPAHALAAGALAPGDALLLERGETYDGPITVMQSGAPGNPILLGAHGTGLPPVINGLERVTGWTSAGNGVFQATVCSACVDGLNALVFDTRLQPMGRWPRVDDANGGYLTIDAHVGTQSVSSQAFAGMNPPDFTGGELVVRAAAWILDRGRITAQSGGTLYYSPFVSPLHPTVTYEPRDQFGFFVQNHVNTLARPGDWAYAPDTHTLSVYFGAEAPSSHTVEVPRAETLVDLTAVHDVLLEGVSLRGSNTRTVRLGFDGSTAAHDIALRGCRLEFSGTDAVSVDNPQTTAITLEGNGILSTLNNAVTGTNATHWTVRNNVILDTGTVRGMGVSGDGQYEALAYVGSDSVVEFNEVRNTGYIGIHYVGSRVTIRNNWFDAFNLVKSDGGAIYTYGETTETERRVIANVATHGQSDRHGIVSTLGQTAGIYIDGAARNVEVAGNTSAFNDGSGLHMNGPSNVQVHDNVLFANGRTQYDVYNYLDVNGAPAPVRGLDIEHNVFFALDPADLVMEAYSTFGNDIPQWGTIDNNVYARPAEEPDSVNSPGYLSSCPQIHCGGIVSAYTDPNENYRFLSLDVWQSYSGQDAHSHRAAVTAVDPSRVRFEFNPTRETRTLTLDGSYVGVDGTAYAGSVSLAPFSSIILVRN